MVSRDEAGLRQGLSDTLAARVTDPGGAEFTEQEHAVLRALSLIQDGNGELAIEQLRAHFDQEQDRGEIGQIIHAYGMYRGFHTTLAALGAEFVDREGNALRLDEGFGVVTMEDGSMRARDEVQLP